MLTAPNLNSIENIRRYHSLPAFPSLMCAMMNLPLREFALRLHAPQCLLGRFAGEHIPSATHRSAFP